nr:MAG TPA: hypothetical protein [Caudoviricetes sp.]
MFYPHCHISLILVKWVQKRTCKAVFQFTRFFCGASSTL